MTAALVDDGLLGSILRGSTPRELRRRTLATTGLWYVRLCQAVLAAGSHEGALSRPFHGLDERQRDRALAALVELPQDIELLSLRHLGPTIGRLRRDHVLNLLQVEALAASVELDAEVLLSAPSPLLQAALTDVGGRWRILAP